MPKALFLVFSEAYDEDGNLWRVSEGHPINYYEAKVTWTALETAYDLKAERYFADQITNEEKPRNFDPDYTIRDFSTSAIRRAARR